MVIRAGFVERPVSRAWTSFTIIVEPGMIGVKDAVKFSLQLLGRMRTFETPTPTTSVQSVTKTLKQKKNSTTMISYTITSVWNVTCTSTLRKILKSTMSSTTTIAENVTCFSTPRRSFMTMTSISTTFAQNVTFFTSLQKPLRNMTLSIITFALNAVNISRPRTI